MNIVRQSALKVDSGRFLKILSEDLTGRRQLGNLHAQTRHAHSFGRYFYPTVQNHFLWVKSLSR